MGIFLAHVVGGSTGAQVSTRGKRKIGLVARSDHLEDAKEDLEDGEDYCSPTRRSRTTSTTVPRPVGVRPRPGTYTTLMMILLLMFLQEYYGRRYRNR